MDYKTLQYQYDKIYLYFKTTSEPFDFLEWNGKILQVWQDDIIVEMYSCRDLSRMLLGKNDVKFFGRIKK